ncbi:hypothetical protein MVEN_01019200 [Mycena venus]|uniref:D-xylose 1-dehydrogenase (NADP(+), D-xylono-1,5-lactone-forming) n=1 Tax=Mycena venus TaxID=2733690 RepID=A0A8H6YDQ9_9AGAR|nr:hypothetical protein MVEN_01019200 [Mycena venus]
MVSFMLKLNKTKAPQFICTNAGEDTTIKAYGTYAEVYAGKDVGVIYIGTPHTFHYIIALNTIRAKKHVLCEKPVTFNVPDLRALFPFPQAVMKISDSGELDAVGRKTRRILDPALGLRRLVDVLAEVHNLSSGLHPQLGYLFPAIMTLNDSNITGSMVKNTVHWGGR